MYKSTIEKKQSFGSITFKTTGTYSFTVTETVPAEATNTDGRKFSEANDDEKAAGGFSLNGVTYDGAPKTIEVTVEADTDGNLSVRKVKIGETEYINEAIIGSGVTVENRIVETGSLKITKQVTVNGSATDTKLADGAYVFSIAGPASDTTVVKYVQITVTNGKAASYKVAEGPTLPADWSTVQDTKTFDSNDENREAVISGLVLGDYTITETPVEGMTTTVSGGKENKNKDKANAITVTVAAGETIDAKAQVTFINDKNTLTSFEFYKIWLSMNANLQTFASTDQQTWPEGAEITVVIGRLKGTVDDTNFSLKYVLNGMSTEFNPTETKPEITDSSKFKLTKTVNGSDYSFKLGEVLEKVYVEGNEEKPYTYYVKETVKPDTYGTEHYGIKENGTWKYKADMVNGANDEDVIINQETGGYELPQTGGIGTTLFTALGGLMTATAGAILTIKSWHRRKENA